MSRSGASSISFPAFRGATRRLVLLNLFAYFALLLTGVLTQAGAVWLVDHFGFSPSSFAHGALWQPITYSFIHSGILGTALELISLWFMLGFLEQLHSQS